MRSSCDVPTNRWDEFILTACYLTNHTPVKSQLNRTPYERWYRKISDLSHLREISCKAFILIQNQHNPKVYDRSVECVLIGYFLDSKAYHCYHRPSHKVFTSFHVCFIKSHQLDAIDTTPSQLNTVEQHIDQALSPSDLNVPPSNMSSNSTLPSPQHSSHVPVPSEKQCAAENIPYIPLNRQPVTYLTEPTFSDKQQADLDEPTTYAEAMASPDAAAWRAALQEEFTSMKELSIYKLVPCSLVPKGRCIMKGCPVFHIK